MIRPRLARQPEKPLPTSRYQGPRWELRRARVFDRLGVEVVLDVGANAGQYAAEIRRHGYRGTIVSFEPASSAFDALVQASAADDHWHARQLALGSAPGSATLNIAANEGKSSSFLGQRDYTFGTTSSMKYVDTEEVELSTLEDVAGELLSEVDHPFLKLDVQGFEMEVLEGGGSWLRRMVGIETELGLLPLYEDQADWRAVCDWLRGKGFVLYALDPGYSDWESGRLVEIDAMFVRDELAQLS